MAAIYNRPIIAVIGGGPAGLMAAGTAAAVGASVLLFEKNSRCGKKLLMTGSGRCNITNNAPFDEFLERFPENRKFLYPAFTEFFSGELEAFFKRHNVFFRLEENGKYFPDTYKAGSVLDALMSFCTTGQVDFHLAEPVLAITETETCSDVPAAADSTRCGSAENGPVLRWKITTGKNEYFADSVIIATGGLSYPVTGSSGDGYRMAAGLSHTIVPTRPALVPVEVAETWCHQLSGVSLKNVSVAVWRSDAAPAPRRVAAESGDLLFTHFGLSGPAILSISRWIEELSPVHDADGSSSPYHLTIDLIPTMQQTDAEASLLHAITDNPNRQLKNILSSRFGIPHAFTSVMAACSGPGSDAFCRDVTKDQRKKLLGMLKAFHFTITKTRGYKEAMVTAGGIDTREISPRTMESKRRHGLYFAGEVIDIDGFTGGFNLQAAFSTGYLAGRSAVAGYRQ
ncbi:MAG: BaiN/RdsA family NAD(P)/FAD-dependent oxidoreductase [Saccharofermentanales bacterium]